jgi:hypothetical protein
MSKLNSIAFAVLTSLAAACGSDDPITAIDRTTDCSDICSRYKDCIQSDYDVDSCSEDCRDMVSDEGTKKIDTCEECLDGNSCTGSVFNCTSECAGIVP